MIITIPKQTLYNLIVRQLENFFPDEQKIQKEQLYKYFDIALQRAEFSFSKVNNRYFKDDKGNTFFNHLNADQYSMFLYFLSNTLYKNNCDIELCTKIFQLNRYLHGIDVFYEVNLPDIFLFVHPLGTVLGRAIYSDYLLVYQGCNIGSNHDIYPRFNKYVSLHPKSTVLGNANIGYNCKISAGSLLMDMDLENNSVYIGNPSNNKIKKSLKVLDIWN